MKALYNEIDRFCCDWLSNLMDENLITPGKIDGRSIVDLSPDDVAGFERVHFFAGIGGWDLALQLAGWPNDRPIWTGSCPCQPLSGAGLRKGHADERHLWPAFFSLIAERKPPVVVGEQVASKDGREWLAAVRSDLEALEYACGGADLCAAGVGAPHIRQRLFWVGNAEGDGQRLPRLAEAGDGRTGAARRSSSWSDLEWISCTDGKARPTKPEIFPLAHGFPNRMGVLRGAGNAIVPEVAAQFISAFAECRP